MGATSGSSLHGIYLFAIVAGAACSVVNAGEEPTESGSSTSTSSSTSSTGTGGGGGSECCGDGDTVTPEECDDSGESATCNDDCTLAECLDGNHNASAGEECDDGGDSADCDADCTLRVCGDGTVNTAAGEECDDENGSDDDGCSGTCAIEGKCSAPVPLPLVANGNGWVADLQDWATSGPGLVGPAPCDGQDDIGQGPDRVFSMTLTAPEPPGTTPVSMTLTGQGWDPILRVMVAACNPLTEVPEDGANVDGCSDKGDIGAQETLDWAALPNGTYYILVDGAGPDDFGPFQLHVELL
ncbi:MAG: hypothetical protein JRI68_05575 [Deltaproteobacteria bacterium]|nr:hypothetical protein [Deltaproteobacteria bacterium]